MQNGDCMDYLTIDIKSDMPPADVAVANLEIEIESIKHSDIKLIKVIHGYGSHGVGGEIKRLMNERLLILKKQKKIKDYINCEKLSDAYIKDKMLYENFPLLAVDDDLKNYNSGITLVLMN